jgi:Family of unknown function (DUF6178)
LTGFRIRWGETIWNHFINPFKNEPETLLRIHGSCETGSEILLFFPIKGYTVSMTELADMDEAVQIIKVFGSLDPEKQVEIFKNLSPASRELLLGMVTHPGQVVRRISEEEMFFSIKELGEENAPNLIKFTTGKQLRYILDIDMWKKEIFNAPGSARWLQILAALGEEKILQFIQVSDPELVVSTLRRFVRVEIRNPEVDLLEQMDTLPEFTLDDLFFVEFLVSGYEDVLKNYLEVILGWNSQYYFGLMEELARGLHLEQEEMALHWRRARLLDHGFPDIREALEIYNYLGRNALNESGSDGFEESSIDGVAVDNVLEYPLTIIESDSFFRRCLGSLEDSGEKDRVSRELAHLANKVMIADGLDPGSRDDLVSSLRKVSGYINIALEDLCGSDMSRASNLLASNHMETLFRRGFSLILDLRREIRKRLKTYDGGVENLGHPQAGLVEALLEKRPMYAANFLGEEKTREFQSLDDIHTIRRATEVHSIEDKWEPV